MKKTPVEQIARYKRLIAEWEEWQSEMRALGNLANVAYAEAWISKYRSKVTKLAKSLE